MQITDADGIKQLGTILVLSAHPDDETFTAGGLLATATANGQQVICVTATRGEGGSQDEARWPTATLGEVRDSELQAALQVLGIQRHHWLGYIDGQLEGVPADEATAKVRAYIDQYQPDSILTFGPDGLTGHPDHQAVSAWTRAAAQGLDKPRVYQVVVNPDDYEQQLRKLDEQMNIFFATDKPPLVPAAQCAIAYRLPPEALAKKWQALAAMPSQYEKLLTLVPEDARSSVLAAEYFVLARS
jgi:LmbE family N-acetylglucosaminyl deacetylase